MKYCTKCGTQLQDTDIFCYACGTKTGEAAAKSEEVKDESIFNAFTGKINSLAGGKGAVHPPVRTIFSKVFVKHTREESEDIFACGTKKTTPRLSEETIQWPTPWLFARILIAFLAAFLILHICCKKFESLTSFPGLIFTGSFMMPIATLVFFFEMNTPKNISFFTVIKVFLIGGCASLLASLILHGIVEVETLDYTGAILVGIVEEIAKLVIVAYFIHKEDGVLYYSNGLLLGAAVGAGFAAFESAGYAFTFLFEGGYDLMLEVIGLRALLAPGGHVAWAAISGYALMLAKGDKKLSAECFVSKTFLQLFIVPVTLHAIWDMPIEFGSEYALVQILLCLIVWVVIFITINNSLRQVGEKLREQQAAEQIEEQ